MQGTTGTQSSQGLETGPETLSDSYVSRRGLGRCWWPLKT